MLLDHPPTRWKLVRAPFLLLGTIVLACSGSESSESQEADTGGEVGAATGTTANGSSSSGGVNATASSGASAGTTAATTTSASTNGVASASTGAVTGSGGAGANGSGSTGANGSGGAGASTAGTGASGTGGATTTPNSTAGNVTTGSTTGGETGDDWYPCDADPSGYDVVVTGSGNSWSVQGGASYTDMASAMAGGFAELSGTTKQTMLVDGDGSIDANAQLKLPSNIVLNICGTIDVTGTATQSDRSPIYARDRTNIDIPHARITGNPQYGMFFRDVSNLHLGRIELSLNLDNSGIGIRIDNNPSNGAGAEKVTNIQIDDVSIESSGSHGVETYGVDDLRIGRLVGIDTGDSGLLLNDTTNAEVGSVHCTNCAHIGTGYAAFRIANSAGKIGNDWPSGNIHVGEVYARGGGRGIFSVSGSGGLSIDRIDIADTGNNAILLQNCYNTLIAAEEGTVASGSILLSNDTDNTENGVYEPSSNVTFANLTLSNGATLSEAWCELGDRGNRAENISGASADMCFDD